MKPNDDISLQPLDDGVYSIDKAISLSGIGKFHYIILTVAGIASLMMVLENQSMAYALPLAKCDMQITTSEQGLISTVVYIGVLLSSHFWGFMTDTWGRVRTVRLTLLLTCIASAASSMAWQTWMLIVARLFIGLATAGIKISATAYLGEFFDTNQRPRFFVLLSSITTMANIAQPLLGMAILTLSFESSWFPGFVYRPWRLFVLVGSLITGLTSLIMFFLPEGPAYSALVGKPQDALKTLQTIYHMNTGRPKNVHNKYNEKCPGSFVCKDYKVKEISILPHDTTNLQRVKTVKEALNLVWNQTWPLFAPPYLSNMIPLCVFTFFSFSVTQGMHLWYPQILLFFEGRTSLSYTTCQTIALTNQPKSLTSSFQNTTTLTMTTSPTIEECTASFDASSLNVAIILGIVMVTLNLIVAFSMNTLGKTNVITAWFVLNTIGAIGLIWVDNYYAIMVLMMFVISTIPLINNYVALSSDLFATQYKGMAISLMFMSARAGSIVGGNVIGAMLYTACSPLMIITAVVLAGCTIVGYYILRKSEKNHRFKGI